MLFSCMHKEAFISKLARVYLHRPKPHTNQFVHTKTKEGRNGRRGEAREQQIKESWQPREERGKEEKGGR